jgi:hypothetical protein
LLSRAPSVSAPAPRLAARQKSIRSPQHERASRTEVEFRYDPKKRLQVRVRDDGTGIDPVLLEREGHEGDWA